MRRWEYLFALLECLFDVLSSISLNVKVALQKRREYLDPDEPETCENCKKGRR